MLPKIRTQYNFKLRPQDMETASSLTMTIPDQATSIREILTSFTRGGDLNLRYRDGYFAEDETLDYDVLSQPDVDISDVHNELISVNDTIAEKKRKSLEQYRKQINSDKPEE